MLIVWEWKYIFIVIVKKIIGLEFKLGVFFVGWVESL